VVKHLAFKDEKECREFLTELEIKADMKDPTVIDSKVGSAALSSS